MKTKEKLFIKTFGCQMNEHDSERIAGLFLKQGFDLTQNEKEADVILLNTCSVRKKAEDKVLSLLGRLKKLKNRKRDLIIGVCGCMAQNWGEDLIKKVPYVDLVAGPGAITKLYNYVQDIKTYRRKFVDTELEELYDVKKDFILYQKEKHKAWITIMEGCNNFCSYCIVPYVRGRERSRPSKLILEEVKKLVDNGCLEITLLGQNVNSYNKNNKNDLSFPELLYELNKIKGLYRIRFVTSHPKDFGIELIYAIRDCEKVCKQIHLPFQAGSNRILKLMNRGYTKEEYLEKINLLKENIPDIALSADVIVGFPTETEEDFLDTLDIIKKVEFDLVYSFRYSPRKGTKSYKFKDDVPFDVKTERLLKLNAIQREISLKKNMKYLGKIIEVLIDGNAPRGENILVGRSDSNKVVNIYSNFDNLKGKIALVKITDVTTNCLYGNLVKIKF